MTEQPDPHDWIIYSLFRPSGRSRSWSPDEITPVGMMRRLRARASDADWPLWNHPKVQTRLIEEIARRCSKDMVYVLSTLLRYFKDDPNDTVKEALWTAIGADHPAVKNQWIGDPKNPPGSLLERMLWLYWGADHPLILKGKIEQKEYAHHDMPPGFWRGMLMGAARTRTPPLPGPDTRWLPLMQAMRLENSEAAWADLNELLTLRPSLVWAAPESSPHLPLLTRSVSAAEIDQRSLDLFFRHGGSADQDVPTRLMELKNYASNLNHWAWNQALTPREPHMVPDQLPLWCVLALQGHKAMEHWGRQCKPHQLPRLIHARDSMELGQMSSRTDDLVDLSKRLMITSAWQDPLHAEVQAATPDHLGDTHPFWAAVRHEPRLLDRSLADDALYAPQVTRAFHTRADLKQATDSEGGNLWWAMIGGLDHYQRPPLKLLNAKKVALPCLPDRQGNGVLFRHPNLTNLLDRAHPFGADLDQLEALYQNPFWVALQANPEGFFGSTPKGQDQTATAMWQEMEKTPWYRQSESERKGALTLMAFHEIEPETLCPKLRLFVAVVLASAMPNRCSLEDLSLWMEDPQSVGVDPEHGALVHLKNEQPVFAAALRVAQARPLPERTDEDNPTRRRMRP